jgi:tetratricopeptide (TPR) repeat protein
MLLGSRRYNDPCLHLVLLTTISGESREDAFKYFITSLKHNREYAPAYTSLGVYYSEHASPPDPTRASKCFQKAFELDAREAEAARRLAEGFADEREWDLVEVVARRTIDGEGGMGAGMEEGDGAASGKYLPTNAWAWKALGVVELVKDHTMTFISTLTLLGTDKEELCGIHQGFSSGTPSGRR